MKKYLRLQESRRWVWHSPHTLVKLSYVTKMLLFQSYDISMYIWKWHYENTQLVLISNWTNGQNVSMEISEFTITSWSLMYILAMNSNHESKDKILICFRKNSCSFRKKYVGAMPLPGTIFLYCKGSEGWYCWQMTMNVSSNVWDAICKETNMTLQIMLLLNPKNLH